MGAGDAEMEQSRKAVKLVEELRELPLLGLKSALPDLEMLVRDVRDAVNNHEPNVDQVSNALP